MSEPQVIRFVLFNPAAPNILCSECGASAEWGLVFDGTSKRNKIMLPLCMGHMTEWERGRERQAEGGDRRE